MTKPSSSRSSPKSGYYRSAVRLDGVGLKFADRRLLRSVNIELRAGEFAYLTGSSGAGKTSLMRIMYLDLEPTVGAVDIFNDDVGTLDRRRRAHIRRNIGVVFQDFRLLKHLTVFENLALPLRLRGYPWEKCEKYIAEMLKWIELESARLYDVERLSGGQQQLVSVARAVIFQPRLLLADEPTGNIDEAMAGRLMFLFEELNKLGMTVLVATHNRALIDKYPHRVIEIVDGTVR